MPKQNRISSVGIVTDGKGRERVRVDYYDSDGKRSTRRSEPAKNKSHLKLMERELVLEITNEFEKYEFEKSQPGQVPYSKLAKEYREEKIIPPIFRNGHKVGGMKAWVVQSKQLTYSELYFGDKDINSLTKADIERFKIDRIKTEVIRTNKRGEITVKRERSMSSVHDALRAMRACLHYGYHRDLLERPPDKLFKGLIVANLETKRERLLRPEEEKQLLAACEDPHRRHLIPIIICALDTGHRKMSIMKLRWQDIDFENNTIHFRGENEKNEVGVVTQMTPRLNKILQWWGGTDGDKDLCRHWNARPEQIPEHLVFGYRDINKAFTAACRRAGIEDLHFHDLKARFISDMVYAGAGLEQAAKLTGNKTARIVTEHYLRMDHEKTSEAFARLTAYREAQTIPTIEVEGLIN